MVRAGFWLIKTVIVTYKTTVWGLKRRLARRKINTWSLGHATDSRKLFGTSNKKGAPSKRRVAMWCSLICAIWAKNICMNVCLLFVNWLKNSWVWIQSKNRFLCVRPRTTPWVASKPMHAVKRAWRDCSRSVNVLLLGCMVRIVWARTHWLSCRCLVKLLVRTRSKLRKPAAIR